jgi:hypothetical protein
MDFISFDFAEMIKAAGAVGAATDQIPFALAVALNDAAENTRKVLIQQTWPQHVKQRNASFIAASLTTKGARASRNNITVEIYDRLNRGNIEMQAKGGTRTPRGGSNLAIPVSTMGRTSRGVPARLRPKNLKAAVRKGESLFAKDKKGRLRLLYTLKAATKIPKRVPMYEDFEHTMRRDLRANIPRAVARAMSTRRK